MNIYEKFELLRSYLNENNDVMTPTNGNNNNEEETYKVTEGELVESFDVHSKLLPGLSTECEKSQNQKTHKHTN